MGMQTAMRTSGRIGLLALVLATAAAGGASDATAQAKPGAKPAAKPGAPKPPERPKRLIERDMFDRITLDAANANFVLEVYPLELPGRKLPASPKPTDLLRVRFLTDPEQQADIAWRNIAKVELYEEMVVAEAGRLLAAKNYSEAYEYLDFLMKRDGNSGQLKSAVAAYLYLNAGDYFEKKRYPEALALLEELYALDPDYRHTADSGDVISAISRLIDQIMTRYMEAADYKAARNMLLRVEAKYGERQKESLERWRQQLISLAVGHRDATRAAMDAQKYREALVSLNAMFQVWPTVEGADELSKRMADEYPIVIVGVPQLSADPNLDRLDDWAAMRTGRLAQRRIAEFVGKGPEGGKYQSPLGRIETSDDNRSMVLVLDPKLLSGGSPINAHDVARRLLALANPQDVSYSPAWGGLLESVSVPDLSRVRIDLRRSHVLPEALLQSQLEAQSGQFGAEAGATVGPGGPYRMAEATPTAVHFLENPAYAGRRPKQPKEIVERLYDKPDKAVAALKRGEIDLLDRLYPADALRLKKDSNLVVVPYAVPTIHVLAPNLRKPHMANRTFRRAIAYAINRSSLLNSELMMGVELPGCEVLSGPFPVGLGPNDPLAYGTDEKILPRDYDPRLALMLSKLALVEMGEAEKRRTKAEKAPEIPMPKLVIGLPPLELPRIACQGMLPQFEQIGIECTLREMAPAELRDPPDDVDLVYREVFVSEPVVDAPKLLGVQGLFEETSPYVALSLRRLEAARDWKQSSDALKELHRIVYDDVNVIPLWQVVEHFAHRKWLTGIGPETATLYQDVEKWQVGVRTPAE